MFERLDLQPADPLLSLSGMFAEDSRKHKIDLGVGVYRDEKGQTPVMKAVKAAELRQLAAQTTKAYIAPKGDLEYLERLRDLQFGSDLSSDRIAGIQTPGGTGALRAAADLLVRSGTVTIWVGRPTWVNHDPVLVAAGLTVRDYVYFDPTSQSVNFDAMVAALEGAKSGDAVLLQAACHNPTGADLSIEQWREAAQIVSRRGLIPLIDVAYQGLGESLDGDNAGLRAMVATCEEGLVAVSCSKSFGLYRERTGALFAFTVSLSSSQTVESNMLTIARANYSMSPDHGAAIVRIILSDFALSEDWRSELSTMRVRIQSVRTQLARFGRLGQISLSALTSQRGMFSLLPLKAEQIRALREDHGIYMAGSGRVNLAGLKAGDIDALVAGLAKIIASGNAHQPVVAI